MVDAAPDRVTKPWTVLVYMAGDNNLDQAGLADLGELKTVGSTPALDVAVQFDRMGDGGTRRYHLRPGTGVDADVVARLPEANTGDPGALLEFLRWGFATFPAERTALVLWNHGSGWKDEDIYGAAERVGVDAERWPTSTTRAAPAGPRPASLFLPTVRRALDYPANQRAILFDDTSRDFLDNQELAEVLATAIAERGGRKLDVLGFDACLMSMVEVAAQVRHGAGVMVGSQEVEPAEGWPYAALLTALDARPSMSPDDFARQVVAAYADAQDGQADAARPDRQTLTQSALALDRLDPLLGGLDALAAALHAALDRPGFMQRILMPAARQVRRFRDRSYVDLGHLVALLAVQGDGVPAEEDGGLRAAGGARATGALEVAEAARAIQRVLDPAGAEPLILATRPTGVDVTGRRDASAADPSLTGGRSDRHLGARPQVLASAEWLKGTELPPPSGLSIYWPTTGPVSPAYARLKLSEAVAWGAFLNAYLER